MLPRVPGEATAAEPLVVVIDGPAGAGKSTVAKRLAERFGLTYLDTGAIYRTLALLARRRGVSWDDAAGLAALASGLPIAFSGWPQRVLLEGEDVSEAIRAPEISDGASRVSAHSKVRAALLELQRAFGALGCVAEGRDMGTVVFPVAPHKFFLTANRRVRAARRLKELKKADADGAPGLEEVEKQMEERDTRDSSRDVAPLRPAADGIHIDSTDLTVGEVVAHIERAVEQRRRQLKKRT
jgi:cytidylate kinase